MAHPQANGQVERMNRTVVEGLKARLGRKGKDWVEELPSVLWAIRTMGKTSTKKSPYSLVFGSEAVIPEEVRVKTHRSREIQEDDNDRNIKENLDNLEEIREEARIREAKYKMKMEGYYNKRVRKVSFKPGDLVLRKNEASNQEAKGKMGPKWEGPYRIKEAHKGGSYKLETKEGQAITRHWNAMNLIRFYV
jgi:hypothetical protein